MSRGIRQGCPISALLYIFVAEILALKINNNKDIQGLKFEDMEHEIKNIQHADEKAFDSVEWNFLIKTLQKFNFGTYFID